MSTSNAWLLDCGESLSIAVGDGEIAELLPAERYQQEQGSSGQGSNVLLWQDKNVPIMDAGLLHNGGSLGWSESYLCLLNFQAAPNMPLQQLALRVRQAPERIQVDDAQVCEFPREHDDSQLKAVTRSCFTHHAKPVLILDLSSLYSNEFQGHVSNRQTS